MGEQVSATINKRKVMSSDDHSGWGQGGDGALLDQVVPESLMEEVTFE